MDFLVVCFLCLSLFVRFVHKVTLNGLGGLRCCGFLAQKFNRRTALEPTTKLSYEALNPPYCQTAVMPGAFLSLCKHCHLSIVYRCHFVNETVPQVKCQFEFILFVKCIKFYLQVYLVNLFC